MSAEVFSMMVLAGVVSSAVYGVVAFVCFERWWGAGREDPARPLPPVTFFRPLKAGVPALRDKLELQVRAMEAGDQVVFGVDAGSAEAALCQELRAAFPLREIVVVRCAPGVVRNPKVSKLVQMAPHARHEHWVLADGEVWMEPEFVAGLRREWVASGADAITAGYRVRGMRNGPQRLDAAAVLLTLWPGLVVLRACGAMRVTLGACTGFRRADFGEWETLGSELAEDNRLGAALAAAGRTIRFSTHVATLESDPLGWRDWWRHQRRVAVTYRIGNPLGFAGSIVTHGELWGLLLGVSGMKWGWALLAGMCALRAGLAAWMARRLDFPIAALPLVAPAASLAASACWVASWGTRAVWWGGRRWRVSWRGRLVEPERRSTLAGELAADLREPG